MKAMAAETVTAISLKNILYATDFSPASEAALPFVRGLRRKYGAAVHALHVRPADPYWPMALEAASAMVATEQELAQRDADRLHGLLASVRHDVTVARLDIWAPLSEMVLRHNIDLIVVGTHGRTGVAKAVLGSVAAEIIRSVACPVLCVGPKLTLEYDEPLRFERVLFATNLGRTSVEAATFATTFARDNRAQLIVLKVMEKGAVGDLASPEFYSEFEMKKLRALVPEDSGLDVSPKFVVEKGDAAEAILRVAREMRADVVILGTKPLAASLAAATHFAGSTVQKVCAGAH